MKLIPLLLSLFLLSCSYQKDKNTGSRQANIISSRGDTTVHTQQTSLPVMDTGSICIPDKPEEKPLKWNSLREVNRHWVMLERDDKGYLIYKPCDGTTPGITIDDHGVNIEWQLESQRLDFQKSTRTYKGKSQGLYIWASDSMQHHAEFYVKIIDPKRKLVLWKFYVGEEQRRPLKYDYKWVMTPLEYADEFRVVDNPCPDMKLDEKEFLPVEFE